jgi:excinuclease UvrABC nuclease subunit
MTLGEGSARQVGRQPTMQEHREAVREIALLMQSRTLLVQRLERQIVALALTLDAEEAAQERLARIQDLAGVHQINNRPAVERALLAQRYRDLLHAIASINDELDLHEWRTGL